jgi:acetyl-CoA synthetase
LNVSVNCLDVHLDKSGHRTAIIFEGEQGDQRRLSYRELHAEVCRFANALKAQGIVAATGSSSTCRWCPRPWSRCRPARASARSTPSCSAASRRVAEGPHRRCRREAADHRRRRRRGGQIVELKAAADKALAEGCRTIERVLVLKRTGARRADDRRARSLVA